MPIYLIYIIPHSATACRDSIRQHQQILEAIHGVDRDRAYQQMSEPYYSQQQ